VFTIAMASPAFSQEQQQTSPGANASQTSPPQTAAPQAAPGNNTQNVPPPQDQPSQTAPNPGESTPPNQNPPATQEQGPPQKEAQPPQQVAPGVNHPAKSKPTSASGTHKKHKAKTTAHSKSTHRPKATTATSPGEPGKVVVRNGGANDDVVHLSPGGSQEQEAHNRENTDQLLATTDENLRMLGTRQLSPAEQSTVDQIHSYMRQAKSAADSGDLARAHTLAFKAHLLSDDLAKH
jgi:hypothetical protein